MPAEPLRLFDPRRNFQLQGFTGRGATTTLHDASTTGVSISGIFQAAEDFAVLGIYNAYDYFNHLRLKHLPRTDLSGLTLAFDIDYDHGLDGAMRLDAAKYPSVSWDAMTFVCGKGTPQDTYELRLLDYATIIGGGETPARCGMEVCGQEILDGGVDWLHLFFRDTRYTVTSTDCRAEAQAWMPFGPNIDPDTGVQSYTHIWILDQSEFAPGDTISYTFTGLSVSVPNSVTLTLSDHMGTAGSEGDWEILDSASPVMTEGARRWIKDLASQFLAAGIKASFAFSMEVYNPPTAMRAKYLRFSGGMVTPGEDVFLEVPSYQMHFGTRVRNYLRQMYKECAEQIAAAGLPVVLQFGETQYWYFDNRAQDPQGGMPFYDQETINAFQAATGHQIWPFVSNTDDPVGDPAHPNETASFLRDRIWSYCQDVISYVRAAHPAAVFECLWPLDANQGKPSPDPAHRRLLMYVNLPAQWKSSSYGIKYFRCEGFDYDVWQKNAKLMRQTMTFPAQTLGRPASECMYLAGLYGPPDPPMAQAYGMWRQVPYYSMCFWAFDQFCLNSRPVPLAVWNQSPATATVYHKPRAARAAEVARVVEVVAPVGGALNRFRLNERKLNGE